MAISVKVERNDLPRIAAEIHDRTSRAVDETGRDLVAAMKRRASSRIDKTIMIDTDSSDPHTVVVVAGDKSGAIHAGFEEFGTISRAANPFAVPAAEAVRRSFLANMRQALEGADGR